MPLGNKIFLASDHAGFELKSRLLAFLTAQNRDVEDLGPASYIATDDYTDTIPPAARAVADAPKLHRAIVIGLSGQGEAMVCNRFEGVRAAVYTGGGEDVVKLSREHNDSNVLSLGAKFVSGEEAERIVTVWLDTPFSGEARHVRRIEKMEQMPTRKPLL